MDRTRINVDGVLDHAGVGICARVKCAHRPVEPYTVRTCPSGTAMPPLSAYCLLSLALAVRAAAISQPEGVPVKLGIFLPSDEKNGMHFELENNTFSGYEVELTKQLILGTKELEGAAVNIVRLPTYTSRIEALANGTVDGVAGTFMVTPENKEAVTFLRPYYYSSSIALFIPPDSDLQGLTNWTELQGRAVAIEHNHVALDELRNLGIELIEVESDNEAEKFLANGTAEAYIGLDIFSHAHWGLSKLESIGPFPKRWPIAFAVPKGDPKGFGQPIYNAMMELLVGSKQILQIESETFGRLGFPPNPDLRHLVDNPTGPTLLNPGRPEDYEPTCFETCAAQCSLV